MFKWNFFASNKNGLAFYLGPRTDGSPFTDLYGLIAQPPPDPRAYLNLFANVFRNFLAFLSRRGRAALLGLALLVELNLAARLGHIFAPTMVTSLIDFAPSPHTAIVVYT